MAKKKPEEVKPGAPAWTATFSDLMNLLLCFFVLLFSMSSVDAAKYEEVAKSFAETFSIFEGGGNAIGDGVMVSNGVSQLNELSQYFSSMGVSASGKQNNDVVNTSETEEANTSNGGYAGEQNSSESSDFSGSDAEIQEVKEELVEAQLKASEELAEKIEEAIEESSLGREIDIDFKAALLITEGTLGCIQRKRNCSEHDIAFLVGNPEITVRFQYCSVRRGQFYRKRNLAARIRAVGDLHLRIRNGIRNQYGEFRL